MAVVRDITVEWNAKGSMQPTFVEARVKVIDGDGQVALVQIDTFGSSSRQIEGKLSQTLQFDARSAKQLVEILNKAFRL